MPEKINVLKGLSKEAIEVKLIDEFKSLGAKSFEIGISSQAKAIISNYGEKFPFAHFQIWFLKNHQKVNGIHLHQYLQDKLGFEDGIKGM